MHYDVLVVGGGPAGCFTAANIAGNGFKVLVIEEHKKIGEPVQCAGFVSPRTLSLVSAPGDLSLGEYSGARIISSMGSQLLIKGEKMYAQAVDRSAFDRHVAGLAREAGAEIMTGAKATGIRRNANGFKVNINVAGREITAGCRLLIGADGVHSRVARWLGLKPVDGKACMYAGDIILNSPLESREVLILLGQSFAPGWFGWVIPLTGRTARVGVGSVFNCHSPKRYFKTMTSLFPSIFRNYKELKYTGGSAPIGLMEKIYSSHAMLVGDAAAQVKPMSGGGIYTGLRGALLCSRVACRALGQDQLHEASLSEYQMLWAGEFGAEFRSGLRHREVYSGMSDQDLDKLLKFLDRPYWRNLIARHGDIDYPSWLARRLFAAGPWLQKFARAAVEMYDYGGKLKNRVEA
ncbi:MAG: NAD(P)/FAD-dependent oxidoreductase [Peptococcaceae bacterium]|nr:NAD(P)/FAD-dependent oxidoreductase [Peptococcaceae bacterium]